MQSMRKATFCMAILFSSCMVTMESSKEIKVPYGKPYTITLVAGGFGWSTLACAKFNKDFIKLGPEFRRALCDNSGKILFKDQDVHIFEQEVTPLKKGKTELIFQATNKSHEIDEETVTLLIE